jgi:hypothetical protein
MVPASDLRVSGRDPLKTLAKNFLRRRNAVLFKQNITA